MFSSMKEFHRLFGEKHTHIHFCGFLMIVWWIRDGVYSIFVSAFFLHLLVPFLRRFFSNNSWAHEIRYNALLKRIWEKKNEQLYLQAISPTVCLSGVLLFYGRKNFDGGLLPMVHMNSNDALFIFRTVVDLFVCVLLKSPLVFFFLSGRL